MKRIRRIIIEQSLNGYKVAVGCETVLFAGPNAADELHSTLARYLQDPRGVEAEYLKKYASAAAELLAAREGPLDGASQARYPLPG